MRALVLCLVVFAAGLAVAGDPPIAGKWSNGKVTLKLDANASYTWEEVVPCGAPPCPSRVTAGHWMLRGEKLYFDPSEAAAPDEVMAVKLDDGDKVLNLSSLRRGETLTLKRQ